MRTVTREEFAAMLKEDRRFCWATLYERQDFLVSAVNGNIAPVREITHEPQHYHRAIGRR